jgi:hypothetical protein
MGRWGDDPIISNLPEAVLMTDTFRTLCAELVNELNRAANGLSNRTANANHRALWAKDAYQAADRARAALARWGNSQGILNSSPQPVAVSERLPGAKDCALWPGDPEVTPWCWAGKDIDGGWEWAQISMLGLGTDTLSRIIAGGGWTHWLPANALPIPEAQP